MGKRSRPKPMWLPRWGGVAVAWWCAGPWPGAGAASDCRMNYTFGARARGRVPGESSFWIYNPTAVAAGSGDHVGGLARMSVVLGDGFSCFNAKPDAAAVASFSGDVAAARHDAVLRCRSGLSNSLRDLLVQWTAPARSPCDAAVSAVVGEGEDPKIHFAGRGARVTAQRWERHDIFDAGAWHAATVRAMYQGPAGTHAKPPEPWATRMIYVPKKRPAAEPAWYPKTCAAFAALRCSGLRDVDEESYESWVRAPHICQNAPERIANVSPWAVPYITEDKNWSPFETDVRLWLYSFDPFVVCEEADDGGGCSECHKISAGAHGRLGAGRRFDRFTRRRGPLGRSVVGGVRARAVRGGGGAVARGVCRPGPAGAGSRELHRAPQRHAAPPAPRRAPRRGRARRRRAPRLRRRPPRLARGVGSSPHRVPGGGGARLRARLLRSHSASPTPSDAVADDRRVDRRANELRALDGGAVPRRRRVGAAAARAAAVPRAVVRHVQPRTRRPRRCARPRAPRGVSLQRVRQ
ncbi:hypothetical protein M885DRAFT_550715 [Pelagophyceae sp. CCMP2097]|nr:hypothetical protein M885DRAFT_550715 [Pelagophyceae sp. CCMP2097]